MARRRIFPTKTLTLLLLFLLSSAEDPNPGAAEKSALLRLRSSVSDPAGVLSGWLDSPDSDACSFAGVTCDSRRRVVSLEISGHLDGGELAAAVGDLTELRVLNLSANRLRGEIPASLSNCANLETLDLSNNQFNGSIPTSLGDLPKLETLDLSFNELGGSIPEEIGAGCRNLEYLDLSGNLLVSGIPRNLGNCSKVQSLLLFSNLLDDLIPPELGRLKKLRALDVSRNSLSGIVPAELGNCGELSVLVLSNPFNPVPPLNDSRYGGIDDYNYFQGGIPESIASLPKLRVLWAPRATLEGEIPRNWGACESLEMVNLGQNLFSGEIPRVFEQCKNLKYLNLSSNKLTGWIDEKLPVPCMDVFDISRNHLSGVIPRFVSDSCSTLPFLDSDQSSEYYSFFRRSTLVGIFLPYFDSGGDALVYHNFGWNNFMGTLPSLPVSGKKYGEGSVYYAFLANGNSITGPLTDILFEKCNDLKGLLANFSNNMISGTIPMDIGGVCKSLLVLDAADNRITGEIPQSFGELGSLVRLDLSSNQLQNVIPMSFENLKGLNYLSFARNNLSGDIPSGLDRLPSLNMLDLSSNSFSGKIPSGLANLKNLSALFLDNNKLSGNIPSSFAKVVSLSAFNVSFNNLSGPFPLNASILRCDSVIGNPLLQSCHVSSLSVPPSNQQGLSGNAQIYADSPPENPSTSTSISSSGFSSIEIASIASAAAIVSVLLALIVIYIYTRKCVPRSAVRSSGRREVTVFMDIGVPITYESVVRATGSFNASNCIGSGGFGATYKAEISPGVLVAIKRLSVGRFQGVQQFDAEIKTLGRWRHPNLVTLIGYHVSEAEMFLIYNYLPGGNLERFIQERSKRVVDWRMLHKIALNVARALAYLHDQCVPRILHRDVKPSNILLDKDFNAYLSDFGLARLLGNSETHATTGVAGTFGYVAPEYAMTCRVSDKADVYSYGVVLLELISDKKALDPSFSPYGNGFNIVAWACMLLRQGRAREFFTEGLWDAGPHDDLVETLHLAVMCTVDSLSIRPTMKQVVQRLKQLQPPTC